MLHSKFHGKRSTSSGEDFLKFFYHIWARQPSWSCDPKQFFVLPIHGGSAKKKGFDCQAVSEKIFENG